MSEITIDVAGDFSKFPFGRFRSDGPFSGEAFREDLLLPALDKYDLVVVDLSSAFGLGSSFLEEVFGVTARERKLNLQEFKHVISVKSDVVPLWIDQIYDYVSEAYNKAIR